MIKRPIMIPDHKALGGARMQSNDAPDAHSYLFAGTIAHVDSETLVCSVRLDSAEGERHDVPLPGGSGPRSFSGNIPEVGCKVLLSWKKYSRGSYKPYIVQFLTSGVYTAREYEPFSAVDPADLADTMNQDPDLGSLPGVNLGITRLKLRKAYEGDFLASSSGGADALLDRDALFTNRAGNEFILRDSDQTAILQTRNEFTNNAAGQYRRGLIKRNAFNILPDLFGLNTDAASASVQAANVTTADGIDYFGAGINTSISPNSAAFQILLDQGLITVDANGNGVPSFPTDANDGQWAGYPFVVTPDGQRISYIVQGDNQNSFSQTDLCYVEDRMELRHCSDGVMDVTEEGDGVQIDKQRPILIERVYGTVVGNDPHTDAGRQLYKRILKMRVFDDQDQVTPSSGPKFDAIDMVQHHTQADTMALAHLFQVQSPTSGNTLAFGVSKEGRVSCHIPKSIDGESQDSGKSVDLNVMGLFKMLVGADQNTNNTSMDIRLQGGLALEIGRFSDGKSVHLKLGGKVKTEYGGVDPNGLAHEAIVNGSKMEVVAATHTHIVNGSSYETIGGSKTLESTGLSINAGSGGHKTQVAGDLGMNVLGKTDEKYGQQRQITQLAGCSKTTVAGVDSSTVLVGSSSRTVQAGSGISDTTTLGNTSSIVGTGNLTHTVTTGNWSATVGVGSLSLTSSGGPLSATASASLTLTAPIASFSSPITKLGTAVVGGIVAGTPSLPGPHLDYITGIPILGSPVHSIG